ncbi:ABC transporter permease, partial [Streptomyces sp. MBT98]|nr:ABC transporter permease [Streptomyces sp. MBT98]
MNKTTPATVPAAEAPAPLKSAPSRPEPRPERSTGSRIGELVQRQ